MLERIRRLLLQGVVAAAVLALLVLVGNVPIGEPPREAMVRIVGRMVAEKIRVCRDLTPEEAAKVPKHMQTAGQRCDQSILPYHLNVRVDDVESVDLTVNPAGIRGDRPVYVHQDLMLPPGLHRLRVRFEPAVPPEASGPSSAQQDALKEAVRVGARYPLERTLDLHAGMIVVIELNERTGTWDVRGDRL